MSEQTIPQMVSRAARTLDRLHPGWAKDVPLDGRFDISNSDYYDDDDRLCGCVTTHTNIVADTLPDHVQTATLWLDWMPDHNEIPVLQQAWESQIQKRQAA